MAAMQQPQEISADDLFNVVVELMASSPELFEGITLLDLGPFITDREPLINALKADVCTSDPEKHVWAFEKFQKTLCSGCLTKLDTGLFCLKCLVSVHCYCFKYVGNCKLDYYEREFPASIPHLRSNKTISGRCSYCNKLFTRRNVGKICRWCNNTVDTSCENIDNQCLSPRLKTCLYPPFQEDGAEVTVPVLIFINADSNQVYGEKLMKQFFMILHPMQVIDVRVTDPCIGFYRFAGLENFVVFIIGGDRLCSHILRVYADLRETMKGTPKFRFVPLDPMAEIGRTFGGRIKYSKKTAEYLLEQLPRLETYDVNRWEIREDPKFRGEIQFKENFIFSFAFGLETYQTYVERQMEREKLWMRIVRTITPARLQHWFVRWEDTVECGVGSEPRVDEFLSLEIDGQKVDLTTGKFLAVILISRITRGDECRRGQNEPYGAEDVVDVYGITEYFKLTKRNIKKRGIKLGETRNIKARIKENCPFIADGYTNQIKYIEQEDVREMNLELQSTIKVLAVSESYLKRDKPLTRRGRREGEDEPLSLAELFLAPLEKIQREEELRIEMRAMENRREEIRQRAEYERLEAERRAAEEEERKAARKAAEEKKREAARKAAEEAQKAEKAAAKEEQEAEGRITEEEEVVSTTSDTEEEDEAETESASEEGQEVKRRDAEEKEQVVRFIIEEQVEAARRAAAAHKAIWEAHEALRRAHVARRAAWAAEEAVRRAAIRRRWEAERAAAEEEGRVSTTPVAENEQEAVRSATEEEQEVVRGPATEEEQEVARGPATEEKQEVARRPATEEEQEVARGPATEEKQEVARGPATEEKQEVARGPATEEDQEVARGPSTEEEEEAAKRAAAEKEREAARRAAAEKEKEAARKRRKREPVFV